MGATPLYQQIGLIIGVLASASIIGMTTLYMHQVFGIGSADVPAPQATLMSTIITGLLNQNLPWGLVLVGIFISVTLELCGIHSLSFAVGSYLPIATTAPIFAGGLVRWWVERKTGAARGVRSQLRHAVQFGPDRRWLASPGFSLPRILGRDRLRAATPLRDHRQLFPVLHEESLGQIATALLFLALAVIVARVAMRKVE